MGRDEIRPHDAPNVPRYDVAALRRFGDAYLAVTLRDASRWTGRLRTEVLTGLSVSVFLARAREEGVVLYIDQIADIVLLSDPAA